MESNAIRQESTLISDYETTPLQETSNYCDSCQNYFYDDQAYNHHILFKKKNIGGFFIPSNLFNNIEHVLLCSYSNCCFSTNNPISLKKHLQTNISHSPAENNDKFLVLSKIQFSNINKSATATQCKKCSKSFVDKRSADRHMKDCPGKGIIICDVCSEYFNNFEDFFRHSDSHKVDNKLFVKVNSFNPKEILSSKKYKKQDNLLKKEAYFKREAKRLKVLRRQRAHEEYFYFPTSIVRTEEDMFTTRNSSNTI